MQVCQNCQGTGKEVSPDRRQFQRCALCDGAGAQPEAGLPFIYDLEQTVNALAPISINQRINNHGFKCYFLVAVSTGVFNLTISNGDTKRPMSNAAVHSANLFGTAQNPFPLVAPLTFKKGTSIQVDGADLSNAQNTIRLAFIGVELDD